MANCNKYTLEYQAHYVCIYVTLSHLRSKAQVVVHNLCTTLVVDQNIHTTPTRTQENYIQLQITTLNRHEMLSTAKDILNCSHRNEKYLIVGLSLNQ